MKQKKLKTKLSLKKELITNLDSAEQKKVKGGYWWTEPYGVGCITWNPECPTKPVYRCDLSAIECP